MDGTPNGAVVRRCLCIQSAKNIGLTTTLVDTIEAEFRLLELIEAERQQRVMNGESGSGSR